MKNIYKRHRFPPSIIQHAVWLYYRFNLSVRDVEDLLAERDLSVSCEAIRLWINKFGPEFTKRLRRQHAGYGDTYLLDEVFVTIGGKQHYLWRALDQDGEVVDIYLQKRRDAKAAKRFIQRFPESHAAVHNLFNLHRHALERTYFKLFRIRSFTNWDVITAP